ncbi:methyl-accepting chemotaxis protein [Prosthecomicrobium sp. N25]|uniref:methyl-accepting chemotaxis protein n=1 Tax=Prosthecomicrobium sp. N25 TaxID=3129254 RepID=UPI00307827DB
MTALSIKARLVAAFSAFVLCLLAIGAVNLAGVRAVGHRVADLQGSFLPGLGWANDLQSAAGDARSAVFRHIIATDMDDMKAAEAAFGTAITRLDKARALAPTYAGGDETGAAFRRFETGWSTYSGTVPQILQYSNAFAKEAAGALYNQTAAPAMLAALKALDDIAALKTRGAQEASLTLLASSENASFTIAVMIGCATLLALAGGVLFIRSIGAGMRSVIDPMRRLAEGDIDVSVPDMAPRTEIGTIAATLKTFRAALRAKAEAEQAAAAEADAKVRRAQRLDGLARRFEARMADLTAALGTAAAGMEHSAQSMSHTADATNRQAMEVGSAAEQTSANVAAVADASEELSRSIDAIAAKVGESAAMARRAVEDARRTDGSVQQLSQSAERIGNVIALINDIAGQTNLLALNATIEAARAGEAGRGFAVVAAEVKALAGQTTKATEEIAAQVGDIQTATGEAVIAIRSIGEVIGELNRIAGEIAADIDEQGRSAKEIGRNVHQASAVTRTVSGNIGDVRQHADATGRAASAVLDAARDLASRSAEVSREVDGFLSEVKAA